MKNKLKKNSLIQKYVLPFYSSYKYKQNVLKNIKPFIIASNISSLDSSQRNGKRILVPYIETSFEKIFAFIYILKALQIRGAEIFFLICNQALPRCEDFSIRSPKGRCKYCTFINKHLLPLLGFNIIEIKDFISEEQRRELINLSHRLNKNYPEKYEFHGVNIIPVIEDSLMRYYYGGIDYGSKFIDNRQKYILTALKSTQAAKNANGIIKPETVISHMYSYSEFHPFNLFYEQKTNVKVYCIKGAPTFPSTVNINIMDIYDSDDRFNAFRKSRSQMFLNEQEQDELDRFLTKRFLGQTEDFIFTRYFEDDNERERIKNLNINSEKKNIFLFTNLEWDVGLKDCSLLFDNVMHWVLSTIDIVKSQDYIHLYIKTHPYEKYGVESRQSVADKITANYPILPKNVSIIYPEMKIKPYSLFPFIDLGVVYFGTLGLEMALKNIPVVTTGISHYSRKGFALEPRTIEEYSEMLLADKNVIQIDHDLLNVYSYFYFIKTNIPFNLVEKFYGFDPQKLSYNFRDIEDLRTGKDPYLDHLCKCLLENALPEAW